MRRIAAFLLAASLVAIPAVAAAHAPSVRDEDNTSPETAVVLDDPTLSRAIGATIAAPGEVDWFRMEMRAGDPLVVGMTAPVADGSLPATFILLGPGLPEPGVAGARAVELALLAGAAGALAFAPRAEPARERHGGLGFLNYGTIRMDAPADGTYWIAVFAVDPAATGKYVLAPGVREEFGPDAIGGMADLIEFFNRPPQPPVAPAAPSASPPPAPSVAAPAYPRSRGGCGSYSTAPGSE